MTTQSANLGRPYEFPESRRETTGGGPDFPGSGGDRERGKFRPSVTPRLTNVAVVGDDGQPVAVTTDRLLRELIHWQKVTIVALMLNGEGETYTMADLLTEANRL